MKFFSSFFFFTIIIKKVALEKSDEWKKFENSCIHVVYTKTRYDCLSITVYIYIHTYIDSVFVSEIMAPKVNKVRERKKG